MVAEGAGKKVLVVEDDRDAAEAVQIVLEGEGYSVSRAESAGEGLQKARSERPDVILLDIMMPSGTEGFHFVWSLRKEEEERVRSIPIVVLTAIHEKTWVKLYPDQSDPVYEPGEYLPVQGFLDKPASSEQLLSKVKEVLEAGSAAAQGGA
jgi:CheY-like chemotaxis protein